MTTLIDPRSEIKAAVTDRNAFERTLRAVREVLAIVALALVSVLMILTLISIGAVLSRLGQSTAVDVPAPAVTACTPGESGCD